MRGERGSSQCSLETISGRENKCGIENCGDVKA